MRSRGFSLGLALLFFVFVSPFLILVSQSGGASLPATSILSQVFFATLLQATGSALLALIFGLLAATGLQWIARTYGDRASRVVETAAMLPSMVPVLFFLLSVFKFVPGARGLLGIIFVHSALNAGLVGVAISRAWSTQVSRVADLAWLEGAKRIQFLSRVAIPLIGRDLIAIFLFVFSLSFASFAVPLMIGGSRATTMEVLIYQSVRINGDWSQAIGLSLVQLVSILAVSFLLMRNSSEDSRGISTGRAAYISGSPLLSWSGGVVIALFPTLLLVVGLLDRPWTGFKQAFAIESLASEVFRGLVGSFSIGVTTGFLVVVSLMLIAAIRPQGVAKKILLGFVAPSSVLTGFALLILWRQTGIATYAKISLALTLITVPSFYRLRWNALLERLEGQRTIANLLGASSSMEFWRVVFPQAARPAFFLGGLAAFWAWGDFAISTMIAERDVTTAMTVQSLLESYRFDVATSLVWILLAGGATTFLLFDRIGRIFGIDTEA